MLIKIFGIWLLASNITFLNPRVESGCIINFINAASDANHIHLIDHTCDDVAQEINKQIKR